jgi:phosphoglucosamine mutase
MGKLFGTDGVRGVAVAGTYRRAGYVGGQGAACDSRRRAGAKTYFRDRQGYPAVLGYAEAAITAGLCSVGASEAGLACCPRPAWLI